MSAKRSFTKYIAGFIVAALFFGALYKVHSQERFVYNRLGGPSNLKFEKARIEAVVSESIAPDEKVEGLVRGTQDLKIKILTGTHAGEQHIVKNYLSARFNVYGVEGKTIIVCVDTAPNGNVRFTVNSYYRSPVLLAAMVLFALTLAIIGGKKGLRSVIGLGFTLVCVLFLFIPMLVQGQSPVFSSIFIAVLTSVVTIVCINGWSAKTTAAILGTALGVVIAGLLSTMFGALGHVSGFHTEEAETLILIASTTGMNVGQLLFSGILIASLGAVMDTAVSISAGVHEVLMTSPSLSRKRLFQSGMNMGRDIMGSMSNTLILAFAGTSVNSLILIYAYNVNTTQLINLDAVGIELLRGLCGSTAVVLTVPLVSLISAWMFPLVLQKKD